MAAVAHVDSKLAQTVCKAVSIPHPSPMERHLSFGM